MKYKIVALILMLIGGSTMSFAQKGKTSVYKKTKTEKSVKQSQETTDNIASEDTLVQAKIELPKDRIDTTYIMTGIGK